MQKRMVERIKNNGNKVFLPCGRWLDRGETTTVSGSEARLLVATNKDIVIVPLEDKKDEPKKKSK